MVRSGADLMQSVDNLMQTGANDWTQGTKQLQASSNGDVSSSPPPPPRSVLAKNNEIHFVKQSCGIKTEYFACFL